jgi:hypothetical protein
MDSFSSAIVVMAIDIFIGRIQETGDRIQEKENRE